MRAKAVIIFLLGVSLAVGFWVLHTLYLNHSVELRLLGFVVETPLSVMILSLLAATIVLLVLLKLLSLVVFFPSHLRTWRSRFNEKRRNRMLTEGLDSMVLGIKPLQHKNFLAAGDAGVSSATTYYLAAATTDSKSRQTNLLRKAAKADGDPMIKAMAVARGHLLANQPAEAVEVLRIAGAATHKAIQPLRLLLEASEKAGDLREALAVASNLLEREPTTLLRAQVGRLASKLLSEADSADAVRGLLGNVQSSHSPNAVIIAAAERLSAVNDDPGATKILAQALKHSADADLLHAIARNGDEKLVQQALSSSDALLKGSPEDTELMRAVSELSMRLKLWAQARKLLEQALGIREERATYLQLAKLAEEEGLSKDEANRLYRQAAQLAEIQAT